MELDTKKALSILETGEYTCVVCRKDEIHTATERGVKPLLNWLDNGPDLRDFCAADRVVGRATAYLYCLLGVREVYARVMSRPAADVLAAAGIPAHTDTMVEGIINRRGTIAEKKSGGLRINFLPMRSIIKPEIFGIKRKLKRKRA